MYGLFDDEPNSQCTQLQKEQDHAATIEELHMRNSKIFPNGTKQLSFILTLSYRPTHYQNISRIQLQPFKKSRQEDKHFHQDKNRRSTYFWIDPKAHTTVADQKVLADPVRMSWNKFAWIQMT